MEPETQRGHQGSDQSRGADGHSIYCRPEGLSVEVSASSIFLNTSSFALSSIISGCQETVIVGIGDLRDWLVLVRL